LFFVRCSIVLVLALALLGFGFWDAESEPVLQIQRRVLQLVGVGVMGVNEEALAAERIVANGATMRTTEGNMSGTQGISTRAKQTKRVFGRGPTEEKQWQ
jgi:hypothetical protein